MTNPSDPTLEGMAAKFAVGIAVESFKGCLKGVRGVAGWIKSKSGEYDPLDRAANLYVRRFEERYNSIRVFGMNKPILLTDIYVRVNILERITAREWKNLENLERTFDLDSRGFGVTRETKTGLAIAKELQKFIVLGKPGSGKTTYLKYIGLQAFNGRLGKEFIPIFISLKDLADSGLSLMNYIAKQFDICQFPKGEPFIERILQKGRCLLLLDGLDEIGKEKSNEIIREIRDFADKYSDNCFILTCRIAAYNSQFEKFTDVELADFTDKEIQNFINSWFGKGSKKAESCWSKLRENASIKELTSIPLLLTLLCIAFDENMDFPRNRAELYKDAVDALLRKWDASRGIERDEIYRNLSVRRKESMFSRIAAGTFENGQFFMPRKALEKHIADFIINLPDANQETLEPDSEGILGAIAAQHGIFVERAKGIYSFSHLTFQEYFTAKYIVDNEARGALRGLIENHLTDGKWREVFLITAGMLEDADKFLLGVKDCVNAILDKKIADILTEVQRNLVNINSSYSSFENRVIALWYISARAFDLAVTRELALADELVLAGDLARELDLDLDRGLALARDLDLAGDLARDLDLAGDLARELVLAGDLDLARDFDLTHDLDLARDRTRALGSALDLTRALTRALAGAFDFTLDSDLASAFASAVDNIYNLDTGYMELFNTYLLANGLLVDCLNTDCYVMRETREKILSELLTAPDSLANDEVLQK